MSKKEKQLNRMNKEQGSNTNLLRVGVIFLAVVSFYTTANGMRAYIFENNGAVAYAASAAIQGILLALSMNLPRYLQNIFCNDSTFGQPEQLKGKAKAFVGKAVRFPGKLIIAVFAVFLTLVIIFCSSWFSYIYIADTLHKDSWDSDSELLVQQTYRTELYDARDYAHDYRIYLEERVGEMILQIDKQAQELADDADGSVINWIMERETYVTNSGSTAASYMSIVIDAMESALEKESGQASRDIAATALADAKTNITERLDDIQQNLDTIDGNIDQYNKQIAGLENRINRAVEGTNIAALYNSINTYTQLIESASGRQAELQLEQLQLDSALSRIPYYEAELGLSSSTSYISIRRELLQLQTEFFKTDLDEDKLLETATNIFEDIRNAANKAANGESTEDSDSFSYTNLLIQMNQLILNLTDYATVKDIEAELDRLIAELHNENMEDSTVFSSKSEASAGTVGDDEPESRDSAGETPDDSNLDADIEETEIDEQAESASTMEDNSEETGMPTDSDAEETVVAMDSDAEETDAVTDFNPEEMDVQENSAVAADNVSLEETNLPVDENGLPDDEKGDETEAAWKREWRSRINHLKAQISAMPKYSPETRTDNGTVNVLSESQINVLKQYDRDVSSRTLDDIIRRYVSDRSPVYKGIIYLQSPYRSLALFALLLAVSFDLAGFIFGFVEQGNKQQNESMGDSEPDKKEKNNQTNDYEQVGGNLDVGINEETRQGIATEELTMLPAFPLKKRKTKNVPSIDGSRKAEWSVLATLVPYIVLTGDYESRDGIYYYNAFKNGVLCNWTVRDTAPYTQGIYIQEEADYNYAKGVAIPKDGQTLLFFQQEGGPQDGIYMNCQLIYDEGSLILSRNDQKKFLANIDEYVPVHSYKPSQGENRTIPSKQLTKKTLDDQSIVVALNEKGTRIAAIYIVEHL